MSRGRYMLLPALIAAVGIIYWFVSYEEAGAVLLVVFAAAMAVMGWILIPTFNHVGPTAPVDPDWHGADSPDR